MYLRRLKDLREDYDYTQKYVASLLKISQNSYSYIERGITNLSIDALVILAKLYNVTTDYILELDTKK